MNDTECSGGSELGPVDRLSEPREVIAKELIRRGSTMHETVGNNRSVVRNRVANVLLNPLQQA